MTAKGQQEFELSGAKFGRNFITLLTSDQCQERICFHTDSGEAGGGGVLQRRKILADQDVGMGNWLSPPRVSMRERQGTSLDMQKAMVYRAVPRVTH